MDQFLQGQGISQPKFDVIEPNAKDVRILLFQPRGTLDVSSTRFCCTDFSLKEKYTKFFTLAKATNADLVITPEYSCPREVLVDSVNAGLLPSPGKLWVIGCQSIALQELTLLQNDLQTAKIVFDQSLTTATTGAYLNLVCLLFQSAGANSQPVLVMQAKCYNMSVYPREIERIIHGSTVYVIKNDDNSIFLSTIICSDALNFDIRNLPRFVHQPYIILHPQLNPDARHVRFSQYRRDAFGGGQDNKEIICLNWAEGTEVRVEADKPVSILAPHSAFYSKWPALSLEDTKLDANHRNGLHFGKWKEVRAVVYSIDYDEHCFEIVTSKPSIGWDAPMTGARRGPICERTYSWDGNDWLAGRCNDDYLQASLKKYQLHELSFFSGLSYLDLERFFCLSNGHASGREWHKPKNLIALDLDIDETSSRVTASRDPRNKTATTRFEGVKTLQSILNNESVLKSEGKELLLGKSLGYETGNRDINLFSGNLPYGTAVYIGPCSAEDERDRRTGNLQSIFSDFSRYRLFTWYLDGTEFKCQSSDLLPDIADPLDDPADITAVRE